MKNIPKVICATMAPAMIFLGSNTTGFAADPRVIKIGYTAPFTGPVAEYGANGWRGILMA